MRTKSSVLFFVILILLAQPALNLVRRVYAEEQAQTAIRILPIQSEKLAIGESFSVNVSVENCLDVYAVQVDIHYNPMVLEVVDVSPGSVSSFPLVVINQSNIFDVGLNLTYNGPVYGQVYYVATRFGDVPGVNGGALLFTVTFTVLSDGSSPIQLIHYPGGGSGDGTYFMTPRLVEIVPEFYSARYVEPTSSPTSPPSSTYDDKGQVQSAVSLPFLLPFAALFLILIRREITREAPKSISINMNALLEQLKEGEFVVDYRCPTCGSNLKIDGNTDPNSLTTCSYCGSTIKPVDIVDFLKSILS
jgi:DNA-directed RNA polymerase subunit RPC12/RpoP